ncbi:btb poz domain protein [Neofusicoccum parvum]|nr:btb poz domain protein [Neofusicoccum parvum]
MAPRDEQRDLIASILAKRADSFTEQAGCDLQIRCGDGQVYYAHKFLVAGQSSFFRKAFDPDRALFMEDHQGFVELRDEATHVQAMLEFMYSADYTMPPGRSAEDAMAFHVQMYIMGDFYGINGLKAQAEDHVRELSITNWKALLLSGAFREIFNSTLENDRGLRDIVRDQVTIHADELLKEGGFADTMGSACMEVIRAVRVKSSETGGSHWYKCMTCRKTLQLDLSGYEGTYWVACKLCGVVWQAKNWEAWTINSPEIQGES